MNKNADASVCSRCGRKNEDGFAVVIVLVFATILFLLLTVAIQAVDSWHQRNKDLRLRLQHEARQVIYSPADPAVPGSVLHSANR